MNKPTKKQRVNLTLEPDILQEAKKLADQCGMSLSKLVEIALELEVVTKVSGKRNGQGLSR
jgi:antitoxin component of RelBE/YafQ-DinJ toxin-antitoxin module